MDLELLQFRSSILKKVRSFFDTKGYLELDTPALSPTLIPETCLEIFKTEYLPPNDSICKDKKDLYLVPSPEIYIKKVIAEHPIDVFQISKCYRNSESIGRIHSIEFTMLEYYTMHASYENSMKITEELFSFLLPQYEKGKEDAWAFLRPPFIVLSMDDAFQKYAGFKLSSCKDSADLAKHALRLDLNDPTGNNFSTWKIDDLYDLIFVNNIEPQLIDDKPIFLTDYPSFVPCLAKDKPPIWKERWELYASGIELANCYSEETDAHKVKAYFENEGRIKKNEAQVAHAIDENYWQLFQNFNECSGVAMGLDRLIAIFAGFSNIESIQPFKI